ncbi:MAG TPA: prepilin-type N-terminal cleavage/methylation domain-containing protein [Gemmatimonadaceae bacterium]
MSARRRRTARRARRGFTLVEVMVAIAILTVGLMALMGMTVRFASAGARSRATITATELAVSKLEQARNSATYAALDGLAGTETAPEGIRGFRRTTTVRRVGGQQAADSVDYKLVTVTVRPLALRDSVRKTLAIPAF